MLAPMITSPKRSRWANCSRACGRRSGALCARQTSTDRCSWVIVNLSHRTATGPDGTIHFTPLEFRLLAALARHDGAVATQRQLLKEVWGPDRVDQPHYLRVYMKQLREKIEPDPTRPRYLQTETGVGYRLVADVDASV